MVPLFVSAAAAIVRQGRCTLVTTIQMYRILAVHCLVLSYMLSAMYSSGVKSGDTCVERCTRTRVAPQ